MTEKLPDETNSAKRRRLKIIVNPTAGGAGRKLFDDVVARLPDDRFEVEILKTGAPGDVETMARKIDRDSCDGLIIAGGDGSINEAVNGWHELSPPYGIIPIGTANVLALEIGLEIRADMVARVLRDGRTAALYPGLVNGRRFVQMAGIGIDAQVVEGVSTKLKKYIGKGAYIFEFIKKLSSTIPPEYEIILAGERHRAGAVVASNGRLYGGNFHIAPAASISRPEFQISLFKRRGRVAVLSYAMALARDRLPQADGIQTLAGTELEIIAPAGEPIQADGDIVARIPARISVMTTPIDLMVP